MRGDFLGRSLAQDFIRPWDDWLLNVLQAGQDGLQAAWLGHYLNSPIWHYVLAAELCGPSAMVGVMIASVDTVGRYFPLTVAAPLDGRPIPALVMPSVLDWCRAAETVALSALEPDKSFEEFEAAVAGLAPPDVKNAEIGAAPAVTPITGEVASALLRLAVEPGAGGSLWWTDGTPEVPGVGLRIDGMPSAQAAIALFDGQWERWGWIQR
jgi:type VI secretion system protein ImpM